MARSDELRQNYQILVAAGYTSKEATLLRTSTSRVSSLIGASHGETQKLQQMAQTKIDAKRDWSTSSPGYRNSRVPPKSAAGRMQQIFNGFVLNPDKATTANVDTYRQAGMNGAVMRGPTKRWKGDAAYTLWVDELGHRTEEADNYGISAEAEAG